MVIKYPFYVLLLSISGMFLVCSCTDGYEDIVPEIKGIEVSESEVTIPISGNYYTLQARAGKDCRLCATSDSEWVILNSDSIAADGYFEFYVCENTEPIGRDATIRITDQTTTGNIAEVKIHQQGPNESDTNAETATADAFRIGYGYNIFKNYMDDKSKTKPILDLSRAELQNIIHMSLSNREEVEHITANTLEEMAQLLTSKETESSSSVLGNKNTTSRFTQNGNISKDESWYSYIRLYRTCALAALDMGMFRHLYDSIGGSIFTDDFQKTYKALLKDKHTPTEKEIDTLLKTYGTHMVVFSEIGGSMDLTLNFKRTMSASLNIRAEDFAGYFFKGENTAYDENDICTNIKSDSTGTSSFKIVGGSKSTLTAISNSINRYKRINTDELLKWQESLSISSIEDVRKNGTNAVPINFYMVPISSLFPSYMQKYILDGMLRMAEQSVNNNLNDIQASTDKYMIRLKDADFMKFETSSDASLVKVVYASNQSKGEMIPVLEICNEYVPVIRGDKRINVIYAIRNGCTFHGAGLFPGDGEGNPPAWLTFSDGKVYVDPIKNKSFSSMIDTVYYMRGNIYETDLGINPPKPKRQKTESHILKFVGGSQSYPVVKIGNGYWTRCDIQEYMDWGYTDLYGKFRYADAMVDGYEFSLIYYTQAPGFMTLNKQFYGSKGHQVNGRDRWYVPRTTDQDQLTGYLGRNHKAIFKGQQSGFEANFLGRSTDIDPNTGVTLNQMQRLDVGVRCYVVFKDVDINESYEKVSGASVLALNADYTWETIPDKEVRFFFYPVRLFRTNYYNYTVSGV